MADTVNVGGVNYSTDDITNLNGVGVTAGTNQTQRLKVQFGDDGFARDASLAFPLPTAFNDPDVVATGTITAPDAVVAAPAGTGALLSGASTAGSTAFLLCPGGDSAWMIQLTGTFGGATVWFEGSADSTTGADGNWVALNGRQTGVVNTVLASGVTAAGVYRGNTSGTKYLRVRATGGAALSIAVILRISGGTAATFMNASIPAGTNNIGAVNLNTAAPSGVTTMQAAVVAVGNGTNLTVTGYGTAVLQVSGTFVATTVFEASVDAGTTWSAISATQVGAGDIFPSTTVQGLFRLTTTGIDLVRARVSVFTSGAVTVVGRATNAINASKVIKLATSGNSIGTVQPPAITKGTQGTVGVTTQDLKDAGRALVTYYTLIPVLTSATDTLQSLTGTKANATVAATTTPAVVTTGKTFRIQRFAATYVATAVSGYGVVRLRYNTAGVAAITSPILKVLAVGSGSPTTANAADTEDCMIPDGTEVPAGTGIGISVQGFAGVTATAVGYIMCTVNGYEY